MPNNWYYDKEALQKTPSIHDGLGYKTECRYRKEGADLIVNVGTDMDLGCNTIATGVVFFHRFYMFHSFKKYPRYVSIIITIYKESSYESHFN